MFEFAGGGATDEVVGHEDAVADRVGVVEVVEGSRAGWTLDGFEVPGCRGVSDGVFVLAVLVPTDAGAAPELVEAAAEEAS